MKLHDPEKSKALYAVAGERGGPELVADVHMRMVAAIAAMLASAPDAHFDDPYMTSAIAFNALVGPVRALLEGHVPAGFEARLKEDSSGPAETCMFACAPNPTVGPAKREPPDASLGAIGA